MPGMFSLSDVFISYSRKDKAFVQRLHERLREHGQEVWIDWEDIPPTADWWNEIQAGIDGANTFVFVISPDSVTSEVCYRELDHAIRTGKRFVPLLFREVTDDAHQKKMHPAIGSHNWIMFHDDAAFDKGILSLVDALQTDLDYVRTHTRLLVRAREWDLRGRDASFLLSGTAVREAADWLADAAALQPPPTPLHAEYILASQRGQARRQRRILIGVSIALAVAVALALLSFGLFQQSESNRGLAIANAERAATNESVAVTNASEAEQQAAIASTNEARANVNADRAATNAAIASTNEAEAFLRGTAVANQAATSDANADLAATNAAVASTNEAEAFLRGTAVANQAATSDANANLAATNAAEAQLQAERAEIARSQSQAIALAARAEVALEDEHIEYAALLGIEALTNHPYTWQAERLLAMAVPPALNPVPASTLPDSPPDPRRSPDGSLEFLIEPSRPQQAIINFTDGSALLLIGHTDDITGAAWSPDGTMIATISADTTARVWDVQTGQVFRTLVGHTDEVTALAWSPDSTRLATASNDGTVRLWNIELGVLPIPLAHDTENLTRVVFDSDSLYVADAEGNAYRWRLWSTVEELIERARVTVVRTFTDEEAALAGLPFAASAPPPDEIQGCEGSLPSQLYPGVFARVSSRNNLLPLRLRDNPGTQSGDIVRLIAPDQTFQVLNGPVCQDGFAWFEVVYGLNARRGWVAEGAMTANGPDYFAEPIPGR